MEINTVFDIFKIIELYEYPKVSCFIFKNKSPNNHRTTPQFPLKYFKILSNVLHESFSLKISSGLTCRLRD